MFINSLHTSLGLITGLDLPTNIYNRPIHQPVTQQPAHWPKSDNWPTTASTHQPPASQLATYHQQPSHWPKTDNRPNASFTHQQPTNQPATLNHQPSHRPKTDNSGFDPSTSPVQVQQSPETDMDTSSDWDNDSVTQELPTGQYEEGEVSDPEQDTSVTDTDQASIEEQNYRDNACCTFLFGLDSHSRH